MDVSIHAAGDELALADVFCPDSYSVHSTMVRGRDDNAPATPAVLIELAGWTADQLPLRPGAERIAPKRIRLLLEVPGAEGVAAGILNSLGQLRRLAQRRD